MLQVMVVDDEAPARARMIRLLARYPDVRVVGEAADGVTALMEIDRLKPDVVFLDVEMPELDGLGVAESLTAPAPKLVFVTGFSEHAIRAFEVSAVDYLLKPVVEARLDAAIDKVRKAGKELGDEFSRLLKHIKDERSGRRLAVKCGSKFIVFDPSEISAIIASEHYSTIQVGAKQLLADDSLDLLESKLDSPQFIRIHRSALINVDYLRELQRDGDRKFTAILSDAGNTQLPVSRERLNDLKKILGLQ